MRSRISRLTLLVIALGALSACTITPARVVTHPVHMHPPTVVIADPYPPRHIVVTPHYHKPRPVIIKQLPPRHHHHRHDRRYRRD